MEKPSASVHASCVVVGARALLILGHEFTGTDPEMAAKITLHAWYCPVTGYRLDLELARGDEAPLADMVLDVGAT